MAFANGDYLNETAMNFTGPKTFMQKAAKISREVFDGFAMIVDGIGLTFLPYWIKATLPLLLLLSPFIAIILCLIFIPMDEPHGKDDKSEKTLKKDKNKSKKD